MKKTIAVAMVAGMSMFAPMGSIAQDNNGGGTQLTAMDWTQIVIVVAAAVMAVGNAAKQIMATVAQSGSN